ncbi:hypothetical protein PHYSODRAFT_522408 [Phytophthora sojae]|uniref:Uncharacterized protein n=1 Tax=Phytophthora sojae (strain P6497) TaxID=1094619 RepID=G5A548_PHYSP|nr:hypothetical protein PHYSODRAFT_522408 [Phytophthora sojae]EGZ09797.1 hypothetical protein PHYSODRAFT_522408 [Phytophthora sojae]|eukprot:XP_009534658.1 hypothetical protein PHYSODRAFT_522408 [Phytophthora sojae]
MKQVHVRVHCSNEEPARRLSLHDPEGSTVFVTVQRKLILAWCVVGLVPLILQARSFLKFVTPHKIMDSLVVPADAEAQTANMTELCPALGLQMSQVWWNIETTHYHEVEQGRLCHLVSPQFNSHGTYLIGSERTEAYYSVPESCANDSYPLSMYFYHGTIGFYSFFEEVEGTYCTKDHTMYGLIDQLGTYDINGSLLAKDAGSLAKRWSAWYATVGLVWIIYRFCVIRRSFIACIRYGRKCDQLGENLNRRAVMVFVHENLRLSAHGAANFHRMVILYLLIEGIMSDLFLLVATEGIFSWFQYISFGYNLSGVVLLCFELIDNMGRLQESARLAIKRLFFSYESAFVGELLGAIGQPYFLTSLCRSDLKKTGATARAVSYYFWGLVGHAIVVLTIIGFILLVRALRAVSFMRWKFGHVRAILMTPCSVDTTFAMRNKMMMLNGYCWDSGKLCYKPEALKAFGLLKMEEEDGSECIVLRKLNWFKVPAVDLVVIGSVSGQRVEPCEERPCTGVVSFFDRSLGGPLDQSIMRSILVRHRSSLSLKGLQSVTRSIREGRASFAR